MQIPIELIQQIEAATHRSFQLTDIQAQGGGSINQAFTITDGIQSYFVKLNHPSLKVMFEAENEGLHELHNAQAIRVPTAICHGSNQQHAWLVLETIEFAFGNSQSSQWAGQQLAALHKHEHTQFGWHRDNTIGSSPQINTKKQSWSSFWAENRLGYQIKLAVENGYHGEVISKTEELISLCGDFFDHTPAASLLHGDLWSGNLSYDSNGQPVIFDPAVYYGDRETDLAMTELFGGFSQDFYAAYHEAYPIHPGYRVRKKLYNLYHILNHMNLFGGGYQHQAISLCKSLLSELK